MSDWSFPPSPSRSAAGAMVWEQVRAALADGEAHELDAVVAQLEQSAVSPRTARAMITDAKKFGWIEFRNVGPRMSPVWAVRLSADRCLACGAARTAEAPQQSACPPGHAEALLAAGAPHEDLSPAQVDHLFAAHLDELTDAQIDALTALNEAREAAGA